MEWGSICDDKWDGREAGVVCRELGYSDQVQHVVVHGAFFGSASNPIHLSELSCVGNESRLVDCSYPPVGRHNCDHSEDAGVVCTGKGGREGGRGMGGVGEEGGSPLQLCTCI